MTKMRFYDRADGIYSTGHCSQAHAEAAAEEAREDYPDLRFKVTADPEWSVVIDDETPR